MNFSISLQRRGISTRKASEILETKFQVFHIAHPRCYNGGDKEIPAKTSCFKIHSLFLDAIFFLLLRDTVNKEPIFFAMGIKEAGEYEILGF